MNKRSGGWLALALLTTTGLLSPAAEATRSGIRFAAPTFVDRSLPGGEPTVVADPRTGRLLYAAHLGATQVDGLGVGGVTVATSAATSYRNQVLLWSSMDNGKTWRRSTQPGGFSTSPTSSTGFSDPDLSVGPDGRVYLTMLTAQDSLASTADGGETWQGTVNCHEGDRPFIVAGKPNQVFLATVHDVNGQVVAASLDGGRSCLTATAKATGDDWHGAGRPIYVPRSDELLMPWITYDATTIGVARLSRPGAQFASGRPRSLTPTTVATNTSLEQRWPSLAADQAGTLYLVWDTSPGPLTCYGVNLAPPAVPNRILLSYSTDNGQHWSRPQALNDGRSTAFWPTIVAGSGGRAFVAWYQYDRTVKPLCAPDDASVRVMGASLDLRGRSLTSTRVPVSGRPIHYGDVCAGLGCIALRGDRRLGDLFTVATDRAGCVIVATADTTLKDPVTGQSSPWSQPLFIRQAAGPSLTTRQPCR